ncbi:acetyltransferase (GNAT) family protein [Kribbella amoyensis]|uniref:Acetyltransferase (GNAT) family protein n=1 Tax=Kribbella amoyensis TaxID=996641 RepID=A0A561BRD2_9ACTN|nr:GNAT family N-acetyltransferase [Kribbella amoyensis]TWD81444.1 acetyltransferase (GNAT) family protein [Kribbella amoyensis]
MPSIRPRTPADLPACVAALYDVHEGAGYPINWPADPGDWLTPLGAVGCWVVTVDDEPAGHVALTETGDRLLVERLFVDPSRTGGGLGRMLLDHCVTVAADRGSRAELEVADNCHAAIALYGRAGWTEAGRSAIEWGGTQASALIRFVAPSS